MHVNFVIILVSALIPMLTGFIWYNPKVLGTAWMHEAGITEEKMKDVNMFKMLGVSFILSFFLAMSVQFMVIHQYGLYSLFAGQDISDPNSEVGAFFKSIMDRVGNNYRTFKHGAFHETIAGLFTGTGILGTNAVFERKSFKYVAINVGYWTLTLALMGGVICAFA